MRIITSILFIFLVQLTIFAQELSTKVERDPMLIGEVNTIIIQHNGVLKESDLVNFDLLQAETAPALGKTKPVEIEVYKVLYNPREIRIQFTVWDSVSVVLQPFALNQSSSYTSQALTFQVTFPENKNEGGIADIYQIDIKPDVFSYFWALQWILFWVFILVTFILGLWLILRTKDIKGFNLIPEIQLPADVRALGDLEKLMQKKLFGKEEQKLHFAEFSDILRRYIAQHYAFITFEKTTYQIVEHLKQLHIEYRDVQEFEGLLQLSDMIKFSKATADETEIERCYLSARNLILKTTLEQQDKIAEKGDEHG